MGDRLPRALAELGCLSIKKKALPSEDALSGNALPLPLLQVELAIRAEKGCSTSRKHRTASSSDIVALFRVELHSYLTVHTFVDLEVSV